MKTILQSAILFIALTATNYSFSQNGIYLDGVDDFAQTTFTGIQGNAARTVEAWINTTVNADPGSGGTQQIITDWGSNSTGARFTFNVLWANAIRLEVNGNGLSGSIAVNDGMWHHVAAVYDPISPTPVSLYVDGVLDISGSLTVPVNTGSTVNMRIGKRIDDAKFFEGTIDEVRVWSSAKTLPELISNMSNELCTSAPDLSAYYTFNTGVASGTNSGLTALTDLSGNGNNGTFSGLALSGATSNWVTGAALSSGMTSSNNTLVECSTYTWPVNGVTYSNSGIYTHTIAGGNSVMCDSIATIDLTINVASDLTTNATICDTYTWAVNGITYTSSTQASETLLNSQGCPYVHNLNLTITTSNSGSANETSCDSYTWPANGTTYTSSGVFTEVLMNDAGCDSIATLNLTISTVDNGIVDNMDGSLSATSTGSVYQWLDCNDNHSVIAGEIGQTFNTTITGSYAVLITDGNCSDTSTCIDVINDAGINEYELSNLKLYPNPTSGVVTIDMNESFANVDVTIYTIDGQKLNQIHSENTSEVILALTGAPGIYLVHVLTDQNSTKVVRVIKK